MRKTFRFVWFYEVRAHCFYFVSVVFRWVFFHSEGEKNRIEFNYSMTPGGLHFAMPVSHWMLSELLSWKLPFACWWALQILLQSCLSCQDNIKHSKTSPYVLLSTSPCVLQVVFSFAATRQICFPGDECVCVFVCVFTMSYSEGVGGWAQEKHSAFAQDPLF